MSIKAHQNGESKTETIEAEITFKSRIFKRVNKVEIFMHMTMHGMNVTAIDIEHNMLSNNHIFKVKGNKEDFYITLNVLKLYGYKFTWTL